jgi:hypothetical protein
MIAVELSSALRQLIDARLDNIERALMTQAMSRGDRQQIIAAIEEQIFEMLEKSSEEEPTRDEVLAVLSKLDPPEAYLEPTGGDDSEFSKRRTVERSSQVRVRSQAIEKVNWNALAIVGFVATCLALVGSVSWWLLGYGGLVPLTVLTSVAQTCGLIALCQIVQKRYSERGLWMAISGSTCLPIVSLLAFLTLLYIQG